MDSVTRATDAFVKALAGVLQSVRKEKGLSQTELAARAGLSQPHIGYIEQGKRCPSVESLKRLAIALETPATALVGKAEAISDSGSR